MEYSVAIKMNIFYLLTEMIVQEHYAIKSRYKRLS